MWRRCSNETDYSALKVVGICSRESAEEISKEEAVDYLWILGTSFHIIIKFIIH
jgi:hypothetical protein